MIRQKSVYKRHPPNNEYSDGKASHSEKKKSITQCIQLALKPSTKTEAH